jgi:transcription initiation factor IIE alpha subunit
VEKLEAKQGVVQNTVKDVLTQLTDDQLVDSTWRRADLLLLLPLARRD